MSTRQWIPVTERLPDVDQDVLVFGKSMDGHNIAVGTRLVASMGEGKTTIRFAIHGHYLYPTHWMPMPEPPGEVDDTA